MGQSAEDLKKPIILFGILIAFLAVLVCVSLLRKKDAEETLEETAEQETAAEEIMETAAVWTEAEEAATEGKVEADGITLALDDSMGEDYLQNCIFLGDSRIVGMALYGFIDTNTALAQIGLNHNNARNTTYDTAAGTIYTFDSYLMSHQASAVYICYGVNGLTQDESKFKTEYQELVEHVKELCPESHIVIQSIWPARDDGQYAATVSNEKINYYNEFLYDLAAEEDCYYLDIQETLKDEAGQMKPQYDGGDGLHYNKAGYEAVISYIVSHPVPGVTPHPNGFKKETFVWKNTTGNGAPDSDSVSRGNVSGNAEVSGNGTSGTAAVSENGISGNAEVSENGISDDAEVSGNVISGSAAVSGDSVSGKESFMPDEGSGEDGTAAVSDEAVSEYDEASKSTDAALEQAEQMKESDGSGAGKENETDPSDSAAEDAKE